MSGIQKVRLNNLNINLTNALIVGIVIAKSSPRIFGTKKKNGDLRGVTSFTLRDSEIDTVNCDVWGSEYFIITFYERFLVGDVVEISSPKILIKKGDDNFRPHVSSPFYLSMNEGQSDMCIHSRETFTVYLPLVHIPTKPSAGYYGLGEIIKLSMGDTNTSTFVDLLVVVKTVKAVKSIKTRTGADMTVRSVEIADNTTPVTLLLDMFDLDSIQRASEWTPMESVLFIADARINWKSRVVSLQVCGKTVITHQPHTADAEALRVHMRNITQTRGGEVASWAAWSGERTCAASVAQIRDRLGSREPFCASIHALLTFLDLDQLKSTDKSEEEELNVRFADHTGELGAKLPTYVLETCLGFTLPQIQSMNSDDRAALRWKVLLEQCTAKLAVSPPKLLVIELRRASPADPIPLY